MYGYTYDPRTAGNFTHDLQMVNQQLAAKDRGTTVILASASEVPFYSVVASHQQNVTTMNTAPIASVAASAQTIIVTHDAHTSDPAQLYRILTDSTSHDADRLYIYKTVGK
jgi:hypothetical protein